MTPTTRPTTSKSYTLCLIGSGVVDGAWKPVLKALRKQRHALKDADAGNCLMARMVYMARWVWSESYRKSGGTDKDRDKVVGILNDAKEQIAAELRDAEGRGALKIRAGFRDVIRRFVVAHADEYAFMTTNWDRTVEKELRAIDPRLDTATLYLHGRATVGRGLYLPNETADEPYRTSDEHIDLTRAHGRLLRALDKSTKLVVYGLSLSALDTELAQMFASGAHQSPSLREIVIIDPKRSIVAKRLRTMLPTNSPKIVITGYHPKNTLASAGKDYSVGRKGRTTWPASP